jgi:hypothetical protein
MKFGQIGICFWGQNWKLTPVRPILSVIQNELESIFQKAGGQNFSFGQPWNHGRRQSDGFFFRKNQFFFYKKS